MATTATEEDAPAQDLQALLEGLAPQRILVTGSEGHLGRALVRTLRASSRHEVVSVDVLAGEHTTHVGSVADRVFVAEVMQGVQAVLHTASLHKPHVATHARSAFVDTNITGTLNLLEEAQRGGVGVFVFTSTTSAFGRALTPTAEAPQATWITEEVVPKPKNIYGATKVAAEDLCELFAQDHGMPCLVLRTSRFFPEEDDNPATVAEFPDQDNLKVCEFLNRRVDVSDIVAAHFLALQRGADIGFGRYIISATTPFTPEDVHDLTGGGVMDALRRRLGEALSLVLDAEFAKRGWHMVSSLDRVYDNAKARAELGWRPQFTFEQVLQRLQEGRKPRSELAELIGSKGYHRTSTEEGSASCQHQQMLR